MKEDDDKKVNKSLESDLFEDDEREFDGSDVEGY